MTIILRTTSDAAIKRASEDRLWARGEAAAARAVGKAWSVSQTGPAPARLRTTYRGTIVACTVRQIMQRGGRLIVVWNITLRSPSGSKDRHFCASKIPG